MSAKKIYIIGIAVLVFLLGMLGEHIRDAKEDAAYYEGGVNDTLIKFQKNLQTIKDTIYLRRVAALVELQKIKTYLEDTVQVALDTKNRIDKETKTEKYPVLIPVIFPGSDSVYYYKTLCDSLIRQCRAYEATLQNVVFHSGNNTIDTIFKINDSTINLFTKNRWQYKRVFGIPTSRIGYTDIYSDNPNVKKISIKQDQSQFGVRLQAISTYNLYAKDLSAGLALRLEGRGIQGTVIYYYNFMTMKFYPVISINKDILRIY